MNIVAATLLISLPIFSSEIALLEELANKAKSLHPLIAVIDLLERNNLYFEIPLSLPVMEARKISSVYGYRIDPISKKRKFHSGIDFACPIATTVRATANGTVSYADNKGGYGRTIIINHQYGFITLYGHLSAYYVQPGEYVQQGKVVGFVGSTGKSTGNHLHYEIRKNGFAIKPEFIINHQNGR